MVVLGGCSYPDRVVVRDAVVADRSDAGVRLPRPRSPMSTARVTTLRPTLTFERGDAVSVRVEVCRDRGCTDLVETLTPGSGERTVRPRSDLPARPARVYFWRLVSRLPGAAADVMSPTWEFFVPVAALATAREAFYGAVLDLNGDGLAEVIASAPGPGLDDVARGLGAVYLFAGRPDFDTDRGVPAVLRVATARTFGGDVAGVGDVNGDGYDDIVVGTYLTDSAGVNTATLFMGGPGGVTTTGLELYSEALATAGSGTEVGIPGDVNGDGFDDVVIGAPGYERGAGAGAVYVYLGGASPRGGDARIQVLVPSESHRFFGASVASL